MSAQQGEFQKPFTANINLENGFFSVDGTSGFNLSSYSGRLNMKFWRKGEKSSDNRDNATSMNINQVYILNHILQYIIRGRVAAYNAKPNAPEYTDITNLSFEIEGFVNGQKTSFGNVRFDTVEVEGVKRIQLTTTRGTTINTVVFCDSIMKTALPKESHARLVYDILDSSFIRFCTEINQWLNFTWTQALGNRLYNTMVGKKSPQGGNSNYQSNKGSSSRYESSSEASSGGYEGGVEFDNDGETF